MYISKQWSSWGSGKIFLKINKNLLNKKYVQGLPGDSGTDGLRGRPGTSEKGQSGDDGEAGLTGPIGLTGY